MKKITYFLSSVLLAFLFSSPAFANNLPSNGVTGHTGLFTGHHRNQLTGTTSTSSENWAGYAVTGNNGSFSSVISSWIQPSLNCTALANNTYSAYWVGLDGFNSPTVEQIGTEANCTNKQASYTAWYEIYPANPYEVTAGLRVNPGNQMTASVNYLPSSTTTTIVHRRERITTTPASYVLRLTNDATGQSYTVNISPRQNYDRSSAEVIAEAPYSNGVLPLADFVTAKYSSSKVNGLALGSLANLQNIVMNNPAGMVATPSAFDSTNQDFSINWSD